MGFNKNGCCLIAGSTDVSSSESRASMCLPIATVAYAESAHKIITTKIAAQVNNVTKTVLSFLCSIVRQLPFYAKVMYSTPLFGFSIKGFNVCHSTLKNSSASTSSYIGYRNNCIAFHCHTQLRTLSVHFLT